MRIAIKRFEGDPAVCAQGLVVGRNWCFDIERLINLGFRPQLVRNAIVKFGETECDVRVNVKFDLAGAMIGEIWIYALGGCSDIPPFLLKKNGSAYTAFYNDGRTERINPVTRTPRPDPDTAVRTKKVKVPDELLDGTKRGSMFSGLMRMAVQCSHARGVNTVFSYNWAKTHGIVEYLDQAPANDGSSAAIAAQSARNRYWVVEISALGVFAAPVSWTGKCCDGFLVRQYLATGSTDLSLQWAYTQGRTGVTRLLTAGAMASAYSATPFYTEHGWAFSRSGLHAQNVTSASTGLHYDTKRWKIDFTITVVNNTPTLSAAAISMVESGQVVFPATDPFWIPTGVVGEWSAIPRILATDLTGSYAGPIHVFYQGESEFVTRYQNSGVTAFGAQVGGDFNTVADGFIPFKKHFQTANIPIRCGVPAYAGPGGTCEAMEPATRTVEGAFTGVKSGYVNANAGVNATASTVRTIQSLATFISGTFTVVNSPAETFTFACCSATMYSTLTRTFNKFGYSDILSSGAWAGYSACILLDGEREGILNLNKVASAGGGGDYVSGQDYYANGQKDYAFTAFGGTAPSGACWADYNGPGYDGGTTESFIASVGLNPTTTHGSHDESNGTFSLVVGSQVFSGALPKTGNYVRADINKAFINSIPPVNLNLNLLAFHGAMYYAPADPAATQPTNFPPLKDQRNNAVWLFPDNLQTVGGFTNDGTTPVAFVGQS